MGNWNERAEAQIMESLPDSMWVLFLIKLVMFSLLQMIHPSVIDTSLLFARNEGRRFKLKFLAKAVLG